MKTLKTFVVVAVLLSTMAVKAGLWDSIKKVGSDVADAAGGVVDATVNVTTSAVQSVSSDSALTVEKKDVRADAEQVSEPTTPTKLATPTSVPEQSKTITIGKRKDVKSRAVANKRASESSGMGKEMARNQALQYLTGEAFVQQLDELLRADSDGSRYKNSRVNAFKVLQANDGIKTMWQKISMELPADEAAKLPDYLRQAYVPGDVQSLEQWKISIQGRITEEKQYLVKSEAERIAREKEMREAQELAAKRLAEREAKEKAEREDREKEMREAQELAAKRLAEREAKEKAEREDREKERREAQELAARDRADRDAKEKAEQNASEVAASQQPQGEQGSPKASVEKMTSESEVTGSAGESSPSAGEQNEVIGSVNWRPLLITLGIWLIVVGMGCLVAWLTKKPAANEIPKGIRTCYFISKWDYAPAMLSVPMMLVLMIGFGNANIGEAWKNILLSVCGIGLLVMNWWALLNANATWAQALSLLPMRLVVGTLGLVLPIFSAFMSLAAISLAAAASKAMGEVAANVKKNNGYTRNDINKWNKAKGDMAGGAAAGALGAAGGWASKKMWGSITSRTRSIVGWDVDA